MRTLLVRLAAVAAMFVAGTMPVAAGDGLSATLDGRRIRIDRVAAFNCHDFDYPVIRCFSSQEALAADMAAHLEAMDAGLTTSSGYVTVYEDAGYAGSAISLASDYSNLGSLGWNDRISSLKSFGATGGFWEHSPSGGFLYGYASTTQVSSLGPTYNDKFSAFYIN